MIEQTSWFQLQPLYRYIRQQAENRQFTKYLEIGATFFLIAIFLFFAIMPTASAISTLIGEVNSKKELSTAMSTKISNIMQAQTSFSQIQENYAIVESSYPSLPQFYQSSAVISYISRDTSTPIKQIKFQINNQNKTNSDTDTDTTFGLDISSAGSYQSILRSIEELSNTRRLIDIKSIQISQTDDKQQVGNSQLNLTINTDLYYLSQDND